MATVRKMSALIDRTEKSQPLPSPPIGISNTLGNNGGLGVMDQWGDDDCQKSTYSSHKPDYLSVTEAGGKWAPRRAPPIGLSWNTRTRLSGLALSHPAGAFTKPIHMSRGDSPSAAAQLSWGMEDVAIVRRKRWKALDASTTETSLNASKDTRSRKPESSPLCAYWRMWRKGSGTEKSNRRAPSQIKPPLICFHLGFGSSSRCLSSVHLCFQGRHTVLEACRLVMGMNACRLDV